MSGHFMLYLIQHTRVVFVRSEYTLHFRHNTVVVLYGQFNIINSKS